MARAGLMYNVSFVSANSASQVCWKVPVVLHINQCGREEGKTLVGSVGGSMKSVSGSGTGETGMGIWRGEDGSLSRPFSGGVVCVMRGPSFRVVPIEAGSNNATSGE